MKGFKLVMLLMLVVAVMFAQIHQAEALDIGALLGKVGPLLKKLNAGPLGTFLKNLSSGPLGTCSTKPTSKPLDFMKVLQCVLSKTDGEVEAAIKEAAAKLNSAAGVK